VAESLDKQIKRLEKKLKDIAEKEIPKAVASALNKAHRPSKREVAKVVAQQEKLPAAIVNKQIFFNAASARKPVAQVRSFTRGISAIRLLSASTIAKRSGTGTNKMGVKVRGREFKGAFINHAKGGTTNSVTGWNYLVYKRVGKARLPVEVIRIPVEEALKNNQMPVLQAKHLERFAKLYQHELSYRLSKYVR
jgi:Prophage minor tail protein Z (GPZ)